jgi:hypothetical protein
VPVRYRPADEGSARWAGFRFREGDIVISTREMAPSVLLGWLHREGGRAG